VPAPDLMDSLWTKRDELIWLGREFVPIFCGDKYDRLVVTVLLRLPGEEATSGLVFFIAYLFYNIN
jgi:hypothetical protein